MILDFSGFDRAISAVMIASPEMRMIYWNRIASRQFPFLASSNALLIRYGQDVLDEVSQAMGRGQALSLAYNEEAHLFLRLTPSFLPDGSLSCVYVNVVLDSSEIDTVVPLLSDGEVLSALQRNVVKPVNITLRQLQIAEKFNTVADFEKLFQTLYMARCQLLRASLFYAKVEDCSSFESRTYAVCDAVSTLVSCKEAFHIMKYKPSETCYVPMERQSMILMVTDILSNLYFRQKDPQISVSSSATEEGVTLEFSSGPLEVPLNVPCNEDFEGIDLGMFSVRRRVELAGGQTIVKSRPHGAVTVILKFPAVYSGLMGAMLGDPYASGFSQVEFFALQYLRIISEQNG